MENTCICDCCGKEITDNEAHFGNGAESKLCDFCYSRLTNQETLDFIDYGTFPEKIKK